MKFTLFFTALPLAVFGAKDHLRHDARALTQPSPANDLCQDATPVSLPFNSDGSTQFATFENIGVWSCGSSMLDEHAPGVWYEFQGNGERVQVTTCNTPDSDDTQLSVFSASCEDPICIAGNDDHQGACGDASGSLSYVEFDTQVGETYLVLVHGFAGFVEFILDIQNVGPSRCNAYGGFDAECTLDDGEPGCLACFVRNRQAAKSNKKANELRCINVDAIDKQMEKKSCDNVRNENAACLYSYDACET